MSVIISLCITGSLILFIIFLKSSLSSPSLIDWIDVPITFTLYLSKIPASYKSTARLSPVCPPIPVSKLSGLSLSITFSKNSTVSGSIYILSATSESVIIVAGFELTKTTSIPSSLRAWHAWVPE